MRKMTRLLAGLLGLLAITSTANAQYIGPTPGGGGGAATSITVGVTTITGGTNGRVLYDAAGVLGEASTTGSGQVVLNTSPTLVTPILGVASGTSLALGGCTISTNAACATGNVAFTSLALGGATHVNPLDVTGATVITGAGANTLTLSVPKGLVSLGIDGDATHAQLNFTGQSAGTGFYGVGTGATAFITNGGPVVTFGTLAGVNNINLASAVTLTWNSNSFLTSPGAAQIQLGAAPVSSGAVAQTLTAQGNTGNSAVSPNLTISAPAAPGTTSTGGDLILTGGTGTSTNGSVRFGTVAANIAVTAAGTIAIKDAGGTLRYLIYTNTP